MRIDVREPELLSDLMGFLRRSPDVIVQRVGPTELDVTLLGSYRNDVMEKELSQRLRTWESTRRANDRARMRLV
jgi:hypothetical protein